MFVVLSVISLNLYISPATWGKFRLAPGLPLASRLRRCWAQVFLELPPLPLLSECPLHASLATFARCVLQLILRIISMIGDNRSSFGHIRLQHMRCWGLKYLTVKQKVIAAQEIFFAFFCICETSCFAFVAWCRNICDICTKRNCSIKPPVAHRLRQVPCCLFITRGSNKEAKKSPPSKIPPTLFGDFPTEVELAVRMSSGQGFEL